MTKYFGHLQAISIIVLLYSASSHFLAVDFFGARAYLLAIFSIIASLILVYKRNLFFSELNLNPNVVYYCSLILISLLIYLFKFDYRNLLYYSFIIFLCLLILSIKKNIFLLVKIFGILTFFFSILSLIQIFLYYFTDFKYLVEYLIRDVSKYYFVKPKITYWQQFLGGADSYVKIADNLHPRFSSYIDQASAYSSYFFFPLGLYLISQNKGRWITFFIVISSLFTLGGTVYLVLLLTTVLTIAYRYNLLRKYNFYISLPFVLLGFQIALIGIVFKEVDWYNIPQIMNADHYPTIHYWYTRIISGFARISIMREALYSGMEYPLLGNPKDFSQKFGSIFLTTAQHFGFLIALLYLIVYKNLIKNLLKLLDLNKSNMYYIFGVFLIYCVILQSLVINDYGFSRIWGVIMILIAIRLTDYQLCLDEFQIRKKIAS